MRGASGLSDAPSAADGGGRAGRPVVMGEVLFDVFPDGARVLGGAPFNVAWNLQAFGLAPLMITRVGGDAAGDSILRAMESWGMDTTGVQRDAAAPTGEVRVELAGGEPTFHILPDQAYDNLDGGAAMAAVAGARASLLYHGSLIARTERARDAVVTVRSRTGLAVFMDVNLREPWWREDEVATLIRGSRWVKLNQDELARLSGHSAAGVEAELEAAGEELRRRFGLDELIVTRGEDGALVVSVSEVSEGRPPARGEVVDTVGAGDAFASVWMAGKVRGWAVAVTLSRALAFAGDICTIRGATTGDHDMYQRHVESWRDPRA